MARNNEGLKRGGEQPKKREGGSQKKKDPGPRGVPEKKDINGEVLK